MNAICMYKAAAQVACAGCHLYNQLRWVSIKWNDGDDFIGGRLFHPTAPPFSSFLRNSCHLYTMNPPPETTYSWASTFNFAPSTIVIVWTPVIFAVFAVSQVGLYHTPKPYHPALARLTALLSPLVYSRSPVLAALLNVYEDLRVPLDHGSQHSLLFVALENFS